MVVPVSIVARVMAQFLLGRFGPIWAEPAILDHRKWFGGRLMLSLEHFRVTSLGAPSFRSPLIGRRNHFVGDDARVLTCSLTSELEAYIARAELPPSFEQAGPRHDLYFDPGHTTVGVLTCGGLCPGLNDVIRSIVMTASYAYGIKQIYGFRYGYAGLNAASKLEPLELTPSSVEDIHNNGGTMLGSSRGPQPIEAMLETLQRLKVNVLFCIGGDGTLRGASALAKAALERNLDISVIGVPKTIDNDLMWLERSFGFATAVEEATRSLAAAHAEARGALNGIGLVKLMGRESGFITAHATLADSDVNFCLVPEVPFTLEGPNGLLALLEARLRERHHAVIAVAEGSGQDLLAANAALKDASGNTKLQDIGTFLRDTISTHFKARDFEHSIKYIDPSYSIRSQTANAIDAEYCIALGQHAVHAGMAGRTDMMVGYWNQYFTHVPIALATTKRKKIDPGSELWQRVLGSTGQPALT
jgi:6-phosphofructokinase 1